MRWGIAGYGWVARDHMAPAIFASGGTIAGIADPSAARVGSMPMFGDVEGLLEATPLDALYVATPNHLHLPIVEAAARAGVPILCEKPLAATLDDAEAMARCIADSGTLYGSAFDQRHHPAHDEIRLAIASGAIGTPTAIRIVYCCWVGPDWSANNWRADQACAGGGAGIDLALHGLDLTQFLLDDELETLTAIVQHRVHSYGVDDGAMFTGRTAAGVLVSLHVAYNCPEMLPRRRLEIIGSKGAIEATDTMGQTPGGRLMRRCGQSGAVDELKFDKNLSPFTAQARAFAGAVRGEAHDFDIARDLRLMRRFDAAYREALTCR